MPIYSYLCKLHGSFDANRKVEQRMSADCPKCNRLAVRQFSVLPVHYRGTGWYSIDSGKRFESQLSKDGVEKYRKARTEGKI